jgi:hypothetical protein
MWRASEKACWPDLSSLSGFKRLFGNHRPPITFHRRIVPHMPDRFMLQTMPLSVMSRWNCSLVY